MSFLQRTLLVIGLAAGMFGCAHEASRVPAQANVVAVASSNPEWEKYLRTLPTERLQAACVPQRTEPPEGTQVKGAVMLVHGFTACPQQYSEWAGWLNRRGWRVYTFLLPGEGRLRQPKADDLSDLPDNGDTSPYVKLAETINRVTEAETNGPVAIAGISVGGAVAMDAALRSPDLYLRVMLFSPMFDLSNFAQHVGVKLAHPVPGLQNYVLSWGSPCEDEVGKGRAGGCQFTLNQLYTTQKYTESVLKEAETIGHFSSQVQIVGVENDPAASNPATWKVVESLQRSLQTHACLFQAPANHSLLSRFDTPAEDKFWLPTLLHEATDFLEDGQAFSQGSPSLSNKPFNRCRIYSLMTGQDPIEKP